MASLEDIRRAALALPGVTEGDMLGETAFRVGRKGFIHAWRGGIFMKLDEHRQELLFEARPDVFKPMAVGAMRWSWVAIEALDAKEIAELVREAWTQIVPKAVSRAFAAATASPAP
jgi:hypothetical protein